MSKKLSNPAKIKNLEPRVKVATKNKYKKIKMN